MANHTPIDVSELDFDTIKANLIEYFKNSGDAEFADWDYSGSAVNTLIDVLAHNTHYNAMTAHMAVAESFIDSAQLRSSVVGSAKLLGYTPRSFTPPTAYIDISLQVSDTLPNPGQSIVLDREDTAFKVQYNNDPYIFIPDESIKLVQDESDTYLYTAQNARIVQGLLRKKKFQKKTKDTSASYEIDDANIVTTSLIVRVYDNEGSTQAPIVYHPFDDINELDESSPVYFLNENYKGKYEISFGNGTIGKELGPLNVIEIEYLVSQGDAANGASGPFVIQQTNPDYTYSIETKAIASGGSQKESTDSIRLAAPASFVTRDRAVTSDDYKNIILRHFPGIQSVSVWGGEDNDPPIYGKAFISVNPKGSSDILTSQEKGDIEELLKGKRILSIQPELVDADYVNLVLDVLFKYNRNLTSKTRAELEAEVLEQVVERYNDDNLNSFESVFRYSNFLRAIDTLNPAILSSHVRVYLSKNFTIQPENTRQFYIEYGTECVVDDDVAIVSSPSYPQWKTRGYPTYLADEASTTTGVRTIYSYLVKEDGSRERLNTVGEIDLEHGIVTIDSLIDADVETNITINLIPASNDVVSKRNQIVRIDTAQTNVLGEVDTLSVGGSSKAVNYETFRRDR